MPNNPKAEADRIRKLYSSDARGDTFNCLVYGPLGTGKTFSLRTAIAPVYVMSFDPGGSRVLKEKILDHPYPDHCIDEGQIIVDPRFEIENPKKPGAFELWDKEYEVLKRAKFFDHIGTLAIDSITTWAQCALNAVMKKDGRAGGVPKQNDWFPQMILMENAIRDFLSLPCHTVLIGHDATSKDEVTGKMYKDLMITGKLVRRIPLLFDEIYFAVTKRKSSGVEYRFATQSTSTYNARSRFSASGELKELEEQDFKAILKKVGLDSEDKPSL